MPAGKLGSTAITKHRHQRVVCVLKHPEGIATADAVRRVHHQRAKVALRPAQAVLGGAESGVEPADQQSHGEEQREVRDRLVILAWSLFSGERIVGADGERERGGRESGLPSSVPGADHHGDREHHQAALRDIGEKQGWNQRQDGAEESDSIAQDGRARRSYDQAADDGDFHSHESHAMRRPRAQRVTLVHRSFLAAQWPEVHLPGQCRRKTETPCPQPNLRCRFAQNSLV